MRLCDKCWGIGLAALLLAGCAGTDIRQQHLAACETYTSALEKAAVWKDIGKLSAHQVMLLRQINRTTTPLCLGDEPSADGLELVLDGTDALEAMVLAAILKEQEND